LGCLGLIGYLHVRKYYFGIFELGRRMGQDEDDARKNTPLLHGRSS
jgi:hypothetical protein